MEFTYTGTETIPENTIILNCQNCLLTSLPPLPKTLRELYCWNNQLTKLPPLPESLQKLNCNDNKLTSLTNDSLPENLKSLFCRGNQLTSLPKLPEKLVILDCSDNPLFDEELKYAYSPYAIKLLDETQKLRQKIEALEEELSLIPEYGENYKKAKDRFNKRQQI